VRWCEPRDGTLHRIRPVRSPRKWWGGSRYSATKCIQLLAQLREYERKLGTSDAQGYGGMIRQEISANRAEYNRGCR
jgi:hypothetical protein